MPMGLECYEKEKYSIVFPLCSHLGGMGNMNTLTTDIKQNTQRENRLCLWESLSRPDYYVSIVLTGMAQET